MVTRSYHNLTSYYNVYFNGADAFKSGLKKIDAAHKDNYSLILPLFKYSDNEASRSAYGDMNRALEKGAKCIRKHSITVKPARKEGKNRKQKDEDFYSKKEYVKWVDDAYLIIGKANFIKHDFYPAIETFNYIIKEYSDNLIKYDAYIWLARTYTEMGKFDKAQEFLNTLESEKAKLPETVFGPMAVTQADVLIRQNKLEDAIPSLEKAIEFTTGKKEKMRYLYILAQLYQETGDKKKAYTAYGQVIEMNPDYQMTFNARINRASIFNSNTGDSKQLQKELFKMLKDEKNEDYRDQIYYALGNIAYNETRDEEAIDFYKLSTLTSTENTNQKAVSFLAIADIYFEVPDYVDAQAYYDSAVALLTPDYPNYSALKNKSTNLNELVENIKTIEFEDSVQRIAKMSETDRNNFIDHLIQKVIEQEQIEKEQQAQQQQDLMFIQQQNQQTSNAKSGQWYFYNPSMLSMGQSEFKKKWGDRKLEDNWRRKNKSEATWDQASSEDTKSKTDSAKTILSNKSRDYYLVNLPLSDSLQTMSNKNIEEAYYNIATLYKEKFDDFELSINEFMELLKRFPDTDFKLASYYSLYKIYTLNKDFKNAEIYKQKITKEFPNSDNAKILNNPDYFKELQAIDNQVNFMYSATYKYFLNDNCNEVLNNYHFVDTAYPNSTLLPKFALLSTLCSGKSTDTLTFKKNLQEFIAKYPDSEEKGYACDVLAALDRKPREVQLAEEKKEPEFGSELAGATPIDSIDISMYNKNFDLPHYYIVVVSNDKANANQVKFNLTNFNLDYFSFLEFDVSSILLSANYTLLVVKQFKNQKMADNYFKSVHIAGEVFEKIDKDGYRDFIITGDNFTKFYDDKNLLRYQKFFDINYLNKKK